MYILDICCIPVHSLKSSPLMAGIEIATKKYWEKPVFSQLMKCEMTTIKGTQKGQQKQTFKCFLLPKIPSRNENTEQ